MNTAATSKAHTGAETHAEIEGKTHSRESPEGKLHLVVIEPERLFREALQHLVRQYVILHWVAGFDAATDLFNALRAPNGLTGLFPHAASATPVVVLSTHIDDMPLAACIGQLKRMERRIKVLVLANEENGFLARHYREAGADGYISKTATERQCIHALCALQQKPWVFTHTGDRNKPARLVTQDARAPSAQKVGTAQRDIEGTEAEGPETRPLGHPKTAVFHALGQREREVFLGLLQGKTSRAIAKEHHLSHKTIGTHKNNLFKKLNITSLRELFLLGVALGWLSPSNKT